MRLLTFQELQRQKGVPYCRDHLRRKVKAGEFPKPVDLGARRIAWIEEEVDAHLEALVAQRTIAAQPEASPLPPAQRRRSTPPPAARPQRGRRRAAR